MDGKAERIKPKDTDFYQQRYPATSPILTPPCVIVVFLSVAALMIAIGVGVLYAGQQVVSYESDPYEVDDSVLNGLPPPGVLQHNLTISIDQDMKSPVYFYYQLENFLQNHRRVVTSRSNPQLEGQSSPDLSTCDPLETYNGSSLYPCGLLANAFFNDTFSLWTSVGGGVPVPLAVQSSGISWPTDRSTKFKRVANSSVGPQGRLPPVDDEDFIVWMRAAALPRFLKLKYIIQSDLPKGTVLVVNIADTFRVTGFGGSKRVLLTTATSLGGAHTFLGGVALALGAALFVATAVFVVKHLQGHRPLGQLEHFNWPSASKEFMATTTVR